MGIYLLIIEAVLTLYYLPLMHASLPGSNTDYIYMGIYFPIIEAVLTLYYLPLMYASLPGFQY
jgi:hypothetical protein